MNLVTKKKIHNISLKLLIWERKFQALRILKVIFHTLNDIISKSDLHEKWYWKKHLPCSNLCNYHWFYIDSQRFAITSQFLRTQLRGNGRFLKAMAYNKIVHTLAFIEDSGLS